MKESFKKTHRLVEVAQQLNALPCKSEDQSSNPQNPHKMWATYNSSALSPRTATRARCLDRLAVLALSAQLRGAISVSMVEAPSRKTPSFLETGGSNGCVRGGIEWNAASKMAKLRCSQFCMLSHRKKTWALTRKNLLC